MDLGSVLARVAAAASSPPTADGKGASAGDAIGGGGGKNGGATRPCSFSLPETLSLSPTTSSLGHDKATTPSPFASPPPPLAVATPTGHFLPLLAPSPRSAPSSSSPLSSSSSSPVRPLTPTTAKKPQQHHHALYKTELCVNWEASGGVSCDYGSRCQFAHGAAELRERARHPKWRTVPCRSLGRPGGCAFGARCRFLHDVTGGGASAPQQQQQVEPAGPKRLPVFLALGTPEPATPISGGGGGGGNGNGGGDSQLEEAVAALGQALRALENRKQNGG